MLTTLSAVVPQQLERIVARHDRVRRIVLDSEMFAIHDGVHYSDETIHLLGEFRVLPETVLVVILHSQHDIVFSRDRQQFAESPRAPIPFPVPNSLPDNAGRLKYGTRRVVHRADA